MATKKITDMIEQRRKLDREIKAAKRAEVKRQREVLLSARQAFGVWLAESVGADTPEAVARLREALSTGQVQAHLAGKVTAESPDTFAQDDDAPPSESPDTLSTQHEMYGGRDV